MARFELMVGSDEFWAQASADIVAATRRVLIQAMTSEGSVAPRAASDAARALTASGAADRRVLVDDYTRHVLNDTFLLLSRDALLMEEAEATWALFDELKQNGVGVRITNPIGGNPFRYPARNHKKLLVMDDIVWLGGINFSDHNFAWHDMMIRIHHPGLADWLAGSFDADWRGEPRFAQASFGPEMEIMSLDGLGNAANQRGLLALFAGARRSIEVLSAYPTMPFTDAMAQAAARGVEVTIHTPRPNNKPIVRDYLFGFAPRAGIRLNMIGRMTHVKAALIDGETLLAGSSNFDFVSYRLNSEYVAILRDEALIREVETRLLAPARAEGTAPRPEEHHGWPRHGARLTLGMANQALRLFRPGRRIAEWSRP